MWTGSGGKRLKDKMNRSRHRSGGAKKKQGSTASWMDAYRYSNPKENNAASGVNVLELQDQMFAVKPSSQISSKSPDGTQTQQVLTDIANDARFKNEQRAQVKKRLPAQRKLHFENPKKVSKLAQDFRPSPEKFRSPENFQSPEDCQDEENKAVDMLFEEEEFNNVNIVHSPMISRGFFGEPSEFQQMNLAPDVVFINNDRVMTESSSSTAESEDNARLKNLRMVLRLNNGQLFTAVKDVENIVECCCRVRNSIAIQVLYSMIESSAIKWTTQSAHFACEMVFSSFPNELRLVAAFQVLGSKFRR